MVNSFSSYIPNGGFTSWPVPHATHVALIDLCLLFNLRFIYGGIGMGIGAVAIINIIALSNRSYIWIRVCKFLWPFIVVISAIRAILMIVELNRG